MSHHLYDIARIISLQAGFSWYDPRTGKRHDPPPAPKKRKPVKRRKKSR